MIVLQDSDQEIDSSPGFGGHVVNNLLEPSISLKACFIPGDAQRGSHRSHIEALPRRE